MPDLELHAFFKFDEGDLSANRAGRLSEKQSLKISGAESGANQIFWAGVVFILLALAGTYRILKSAMGTGMTLTNTSYPFKFLSAEQVK